MVPGVPLYTHGMGEIVEDRQQKLSSDSPKVAVAVGKGDSSFQAFKWTLEKVVPAGGSLHLLHVRPRLHFIQTALGPLPIDQANDESVKRAKRQHFSTTEKLLQKYKKMGEKNKVVLEVHYIENDSVHKAVVEQIFTLGISKLILGSSSQSKITKLLKGPGTEVLIAQHAPDFCAVMVVRKGKLCSVKDASKSFSSVSSDTSLFSSSGHITSIAGMNEEVLPESPTCILSTDIKCQDWMFPSTPLGQVASDSGFMFNPIDNKEICHGGFKDNSMHLAHVHKRQSSVSQVSSKQCSTGVTKQYGLPGVSPPRSEGHKLVAPALKILHSANDGSPQLRGVITKKTHDNCEFLEASNAAVGGWETNSKADITSNSVSSIDGLRQTSCESMEKNLHLENTTTTTTHEAKGFVLQRKEGSQIMENALEELKSVRLQLEAEMKRRGELCDALQEARQVAKDASRDKEIALQAVADETKKLEEAVTALTNAKAEATAFEREAHFARQKAAAEKSRYEKALADFEDIKKDLAREVQLRKSAEESVRRETLAKQEAIAALQKAQRKYTEYSFEELQEATNNFAEDQKLGEGGYGGVYKGTVHHTDVAVKVLTQAGSATGRQQFQREVELLSHIRHPHMVTLLGACHEKACIVYEYMANGSLEDCLTCKDGKPPLPWHVRFRICSEVATALLFLHNSSPKPIIHRDLKPGNILLDHNFVSKISDVGIAQLIPNSLTYSATVYRETIPQGTFVYMDPEYLRTGSCGPHSDVYALGILILQVLTGQQAFGLVDKVESAICDSSLKELLDSSAGDWPLSESLKLAKLGLKCAEPRRRDRPDLGGEVFVVLENIRKVAQAAATTEANQKSLNSCKGTIIPSFFICPISQEVMDDPHIAADGFTYEYRSITNWLNGHSTSPMTNLALDHKNVIQDCSLRLAILEWRAKCHAP